MQTRKAHRRGGEAAAIWLQGRDLNPRPRGYEPREIPLLHPDTESSRPSFGGLLCSLKNIGPQVTHRNTCMTADFPHPLSGHLFPLRNRARRDSKR